MAKISSSKALQMNPSSIKFREATGADVPAMTKCRLADPIESDADPRMAAYFDGQHHPQQALPQRIGYVALDKNVVIGYIAGHRTTRNGCAGEIQYLFVTPAYRRQGVATALLRLLAKWFQAQAAERVCVGVANDSPPEAKPFFERSGASPLKRNWYGWEDIGIILSAEELEGELRCLRRVPQQL